VTAYPELEVRGGGLLAVERRMVDEEPRELLRLIGVPPRQIGLTDVTGVVQPRQLQAC
jgi:hypothetical protein